MKEDNDLLPCEPSGMPKGALGTGQLPSGACGDCGHSADEHYDKADCMHYDNHGGCACWQYVTEEAATPAMRARRLFGQQHHSVYSYRVPFSGGMCCHRACSCQAVRRIMVNIWGSVCEYDVCEPHALRYHGKLVDEFPCETAPVQSTANPQEPNSGAQGGKSDALSV